MATATSVSRAACFSLPTAYVSEAAAARASANCVQASWWNRSVPAAVAAALVGGVVLAGAAILEVVRAWTSAPHAGAEAAQVVGGILVAMFVIAAFGLATRTRALGIVAITSAFALIAHGATLVLQGESVGALFLALSPIVALLTSSALAPSPIARAGLARATVSPWSKSSHQNAPTARRVASRIPLATHA